MMSSFLLRSTFSGSSGSAPSQRSLDLMSLLPLTVFSGAIRNWNFDAFGSTKVFSFTFSLHLRWFRSDLCGEMLGIGALLCRFLTFMGTFPGGFDHRRLTNAAREQTTVRNGCLRSSFLRVIINHYSLDSPSNESSQTSHKSMFQYFLWCDPFRRFEMKHFHQQVHQKD